MVFTDDFAGFEGASGGWAPFELLAGVRRMLFRRYEDVENGWDGCTGTDQWRAVCARVRADRSDMAMGLWAADGMLARNLLAVDSPPDRSLAAPI